MTVYIIASLFEIYCVRVLLNLYSYGSCLIDNLDVQEDHLHIKNVVYWYTNRQTYVLLPTYIIFYKYGYI
jgi:hypothetical protein